MDYVVATEVYTIIQRVLQYEDGVCLKWNRSVTGQPCFSVLPIVIVQSIEIRMETHTKKHVKSAKRP